MGKILVGRDDPKEVEVGFTLATTPSVEEKEVADAEEKEESPEAPVEAVEDVQPEAEVFAKAPAAPKAVVKGRGKKGRKS